MKTPNRRSAHNAWTVTLILSLVLFASCTKDIGVQTNSRNTDPQLKAAAIVFTSNLVFDFNFTVFVPCANGGLGEDVTFTGSLHDLFHLTINGNSFTVKFHDQPQGLKGVGAVTGDVYNATGVTQATENGSFVNGSYSYNYVNNVKLIGPGPGNNLLIHETFKVTVNANGTLVVLRDHFTIDCK
ncbi:hypothetical protein BH10BAC3_BH10BAC3_42060 [soil metagenome]